MFDASFTWVAGPRSGDVLVALDNSEVAFKGRLSYLI